MGISGKIAKLMRWGNIWLSQFEAAGANNRRCEANSGNALIIKLDAIGDFIIWLDSAKEFRNLYPDKKLWLMCGGACVDIAKSTGYFDEIITLNIRKFESDNAYKKEILQDLQQYSFDLLIQTAYSRTVHMDLLAASVAANKKVGLVCDETRTNLSRYITTKGNAKKLDGIYDQLIPVSTDWLMEVKRNAELIRGLGMTDFKSSMPVLKEYAVKQEIIPKKPYYVLFPGASTPKKMWNVEKFAQVADHLFKEKGWTGYVCGAKEEQHLYQEIQGYVGKDTVVEDYLGKTTLLELAEVIRQAEIVISNDTSGIHFAAAVGTPSVCILGEYNYGRFLPYDYDTKTDADKASMIVCHADMPCKRCAVGKMTAECNACMATTGRYLCVDKITAQEVIKAVEQLI